MSQGKDYYEDKGKLWEENWFETKFQYGEWARSRDFNYAKTMDSLYDSYHPYCCNTCKRGSLHNLNLVQCSECKIMRYCCKDHQKKNWRVHKKWCKPYTKVISDDTIAKNNNDEDDEKVSMNHAEWMRQQNEINERLMNTIGMRHNTEHQIAALQPHCRRCFRSGRLPGINLVVCPSCSGVAVCKSCLGDEHAAGSTWEAFHNGDQQECESHLIYLCCSGMIVEQGSHQEPTASDTNCKETFHPKDWFDYFEKKGNDFDNGGKLPFPMPISRLRFMAPITCFLTENLTMPLTINMFLGKLDLLKKSELCIHVLGAANNEVQCFRAFVELGRLNPQLKRLDLVMVGLNLHCNASFPFKNLTYNREAPCHLDGTLEQVVGLYHNSAAANGPAPDCFVAFNAGIHDPHHFVSWKPTLELVKTTGIPLCITGFNFLEVQKDMNILKTTGFHENIPPTANPFRSMRPYLDPAREETDFYYNNKAYAVMQGH